MAKKLLDDKRFDKTDNRKLKKGEMVAFLDEVLNVIYTYYPKKLYFNDSKYKGSPQYIMLMENRKENLDNLNSGENLKAELQQILKQYSILDWTDLESSNCYEYRVLLHKGQSIMDDDVQLIGSLGGTRFDLYLFISILNNYFYYFVSKSMLNCNSNKWKFENIDYYSEDVQDVVNVVKKFFVLKNYKQITKDKAEIIVEDIDTKYIEKGKVKVFNCLFTELIMP